MYQSRFLHIPGHHIELIGQRAMNVDGCYCQNEHEAARLLDLIDLYENLPKLSQANQAEPSQPSSRCDHCNEPARHLFGLSGRFLCRECYEAEHQEIGGGA